MNNGKMFNLVDIFKTRCDIVSRTISSIDAFNDGSFKCVKIVPRQICNEVGDFYINKNNQLMERYRNAAGVPIDVNEGDEELFKISGRMAVQEALTHIIEFFAEHQTKERHSNESSTITVSCESSIENRSYYFVLDIAIVYNQIEGIGYTSVCAAMLCLLAIMLVYDGEKLSSEDNTEVYEVTRTLATYVFKYYRNDTYILDLSLDERRPATWNSLIDSE